MSSCPSLCKEDIRERAIADGAVACGFARAEEVEASAAQAYDRWIAAGRHGDMDYCARYGDVKRDPRLLLDGAKTVISCAYSYNTGECAWPMAPRIARYAWGKDYHWVVKQRLTMLGEYITKTYGGVYRACVDTAPIRERYWAVKAGIGFIGRNNQLIVPGWGSYVFLGELLWTGEVPADEPCKLTCEGCGVCVRACPGKALDGEGGCDARRCLSYLTIEHKGDVPETMETGAHIYGCDVCQEVCPHCKGVKTTEIEEFQPDKDIMRLTLDEIQEMTSSHWRKLTRESAMSRIPLRKLISNIRSGSKNRY